MEQQEEEEEEEDAEGQREEEEEEEGDMSEHARVLEAVALQAGGTTWGGEGANVDDALAATAGEPSGSEAAQEEEAALERSTEPETGADD